LQITLRKLNSNNREDFINLWNEIFKSKPKFTQLTLSKFEHIITKPNLIPFDQTALILIYFNDTPIGFFHFLLAPNLLKQNFFNLSNPQEEVLLISCFAVSPQFRRRGIATNTLNYIIENYHTFFSSSSQPPKIELCIANSTLPKVRSLRSPMIIFDTKNISNFWSNALYPDEILWGHSEGIGIEKNDLETIKFVEKFFIRKLKTAIELKLDIEEFHFVEQKKEVITLTNTEPILGEKVEKLRAFHTSYPSKTFITLSEEGTIDGYIVVSPIKAENIVEWGIYELNTLQKGQKIGTALLNESIKFLKQIGCKILYTITIPEESPTASAFYTKHNFKEINEWVV
jgi:N-acetylglutamate synthase-like GNAT family acetyltransferase